MNNKKRTSIDGFVPRRPGSQIGERHTNSSPVVNGRRKELKSKDDLQKAPLGAPRRGREIGKVTAIAKVANSGRADIEDSLSQLGDIDQPSPVRKLSRRDKRRLKNEQRTKAQRVRRRIILSIVWVIVALLVAVGGFFAYKTLTATGHVLNGTIFDLIQNEPLKEDSNGRSNFLILGTSEDDPGHEAGYLTDSIMVLSINQTKKDMYMFSIPRDLYVDYQMPCLSGYKGKINVYFSCVNDGTDDAAEQDRLQKTQKFIGGITGLDIQYGVHVNYTVMRDVVKAIGGKITVTIDSRDPRGVMDSNFDWKCGPSYYERIAKCPPDGHFIQYPNGKVTLDAEHALYLAQARGDRAPTYGFEQSNFDRERNQQMIAVAIRDKAMSAGTLTNLGAISGLIDALGNNLRTNIQTKEVRTLMDLAQHIPSEKISSLDFYAEDNRIFTTGTIPGAGSSVYPAAGVFEYSALQAFIKKQVSSEAFVKEDAKLVVLNGSGEAGVAQRAADSLEGRGFAILNIDNAPDGTYKPVEIYQLSSTKTATAAKLKEIYGVAPLTSTPPVSVVGEADFVIIIGSVSALH